MRPLFTDMNHDIVYILRQDVTSEELKYSLRSVEQNFPHDKVWFFCGCPKDIKPDRYVRMSQSGITKWQRSTSTLRAICTTEEVSDDFWLFNDDFFILKKIKTVPYMVRGSLEHRVLSLKSKRRVHRYADNLEEARLQLIAYGCDTLDYALHVPMLINKEKALEVLNKFPDCPMFRSLYGNYWKVGGVLSDDVKINNVIDVPKNQTLLSTNDDSFETGNVGKYIKSKFTEKSRWEK